MEEDTVMDNMIGNEEIGYTNEPAGIEPEGDWRGNPAETEEKKMVRIEFSTKQVLSERTMESEKDGHKFVPVMGPCHSTFLCNVDDLKPCEGRDDRVYIEKPEGKKIKLQFYSVNKDIPEGEAGHFENHSDTWKIEDVKDCLDEEREVLKKIYRDRREKRAEESDFANVTVPDEFGKRFTSDKGGEPKDYVSMTVPIKEGDATNRYSFVIPAEQFRKSEYNEGMSYFGFPKTKQGTDEPYMVTLQRRIQNQDGSWGTISREIPGAELAKSIKEYVSGIETEEVTVSEKLVREFTTKDNERRLFDVSIPILKEGEGGEKFFHAVVPAYRVKESDVEGYVNLELISDYKYKARRTDGEKDDNGQFVKTGEEVIKLSGKEIGQKFAESRGRYLDGIFEGADVSEAIVSEKLVRQFESKVGAQLADVSIPILKEGEGEETFFHAIVPAERVEDSGRDGMLKVSLSSDRTYVLRHTLGETGEDGKFAKTGEETVRLTGSEIKEKVEESRKRYLDGKQDGEQAKVAEEQQQYHARRGR